MNREKILIHFQYTDDWKIIQEEGIKVDIVALKLSTNLFIVFDRDERTPHFFVYDKQHETFRGASKLEDEIFNLYWTENSTDLPESVFINIYNNNR